MDKCGVPNAMGVMAGNIMQSQQHLEAVREFNPMNKAASAFPIGLEMGMGLDMIKPHDTMMGGHSVGPVLHPDQNMINPHLPHFPELMMPPPAVVDGPISTFHPDALADEFHRMQLEHQTQHFEHAFSSASFAPPPPAAMMHMPPPDAWASEFHQMPPMQSLPPSVDYESVYESVISGPQSVDWSSKSIDELDAHFRAVDEELEQSAYEEAFADEDEQLAGAWSTTAVENPVSDFRSSVNNGIEKSMLDRLLATSDPKLKNSKFMQFLSKISTGEIELKDNQAIVRPAPMVSSSDWASAYASAEEIAQEDAWAEDYAPEEQLASSSSALDQAERWAQDFEAEQQAFDAEYGADEEDTEAPEWLQEYQNFDWVKALNDAKYGPHQTPPDPVYQFAPNNHYLSLEDPLSEATRLFEAGNLSEAVLAFEASVQKNPENADSWRLLGQCHAENEEENAAIAALLKAVELDPYHLEALLLLAVSFTNDFEQNRALTLLKAWLHHHPDHQELQHDAELQNFAEMYAEDGEAFSSSSSVNTTNNPVSASLVTAMFNKASQTNPKDPEVLVALGVLYNISSEYDHAVECFRRASELRPDDPSIWNKLGATLANSQHCPEAVHAYKKALELRPNYVRALANLGIAYANQGMHQDAATIYLSTLARNPKAQHVWSYLRLSLASMGREDLMQLAHEQNLDAFRQVFSF